MSHIPLLPGQIPPAITLALNGGGQVSFAAPGWRLFVIYRGAHCPMCRAYLAQAESFRAHFAAAGIELVLASADTAEQTTALMAETGYAGPVAINLAPEHMAMLGLFITDAGVAGAPRQFAEPAAFAVDGDGRLHAVQISNAPYARPDLQALLSGLVYDRDNGVAARGAMR